MADERPIPLDEYPIHQAPLSMRHVVSSDRAAYDRSIYQVFDHHGEAILIAGLGVYPNLGLIDAYATVTHGDVQHVVRASDALTEDRMAQVVGPIRIEVQEPLRRVRLICEGDPADDTSLAFDVVWDAASPAIWEPHHVMRSGDKQILDGRRFVQGGRPSGVIRLDGTDVPVTVDGWSATRDRSWGIRSTGGETPGRYADELAFGGFWWLWLPMQFDDHFILVIAQEDENGFRVLSEALRVWDPALGRPDENLGWPLVDIHYIPGTRRPTGASVHLIEPDRTPFTIEVTSLIANPISLGPGYPPDPEWTHGEWKGRNWVERKQFDLTDPTVTGHVPFGLLDHAAKVSYREHEGYALFEHASIGRHTPSGMDDLGSVSP